MQCARKSVGAVEGGLGSHYHINLTLYTRFVSSLRNNKMSWSCIFLMSIAIRNFGHPRQIGLCSKGHDIFAHGRGFGNNL